MGGGKGRGEKGRRRKLEKRRMEERRKVKMGMSENGGQSIKVTYMNE